MIRLLARCFAALASLAVFAAPSVTLAQTRAADGAEVCHLDDPAWDAAALANAQSIDQLAWAPFGTPEWGWDTYLPLMQRELGTRCAAQSAVFAQRLAGWQTRYALPATGVFGEAEFQVLRAVLQERRPFLMARVRGECPEPPPISELAYLTVEEEAADRLTRLLRRDTLDAWRRMVAAARAEVPAVAANTEFLQIVSGWRDPVEDAARCAQDGNCDGLRRAECSAHRTGAAIDLYVGHLTGMGVVSTEPASRHFMSHSPAYLWLVSNAHRFGFVPYLYEPWHWEYVGEPAG